MVRNRIPKGPWPIIIITLLLAAVILVLGDQSFKATERAAFDEFNQRQLVLATEATSGIELYFETLAGDMRALASVPEVQHFHEARTRWEMQRTFDKLVSVGVNDIGVLDAGGVLRYNVAAPQIEGVDFSWRRYYQEVMALTSSDSYVIEFIEFKGVEAGQKGVLIAVPMFTLAAERNSSTTLGQPAGVALCTLKLDTVTQRFIAPVKSSERGHSFLIDDEHNVLWAPARSLFGESLLEAGGGFPIFQRVLETMSSGYSGTAEYSYYGFDDHTNEYAEDKEEENLIAYAPIHLGNERWAVGVWAPKQDARQLIRSAYIRQLLVVRLSLLIILLGSSYALATSHRTSRFLEKEVEAKTGELAESHARLLTALGSLEAAHASQQTIIDGVADSIMVVGTDHHVQLMNRAARDFSSGSLGPSEPVLCYQITHQADTPCDGTEHPCPLEQVRRSGQSVTVVHEHCQANGERRIVEVVASPLWGEDGAFQGIVESIRDITEHRRAQEALGMARARQQSLIDEERQRIARELHDGLGQLLGYVNTKAMAVRLMLRGGQTEAADQHLLQLEEAARDLFVDVRQAILDLKVAGQSDTGLTDALKDFTAQFSQLSGLPVQLTIAPPVEDSPLTSEMEVHMLRIVQESLANVRKHASATQAWVSLQVHDGVLELTVGDDGRGFDPQHIPIADRPHFGLSTMRERAEAIGAEFHLRSEAGGGTHVTVRLAITDLS